MKVFCAHNYFEELTSKLRLTKDGNYRFCRVSGMGNLEEVISNYSNSPAYLAIDDTNDGYTYRGSGGTFYERRMYTVFILKRFTLGNMKQQSLYLNECRAIYRSIIKRLLHDRTKLENEMIYLQTNRIAFYELEGYAMSGCTGVYMTFTVDQPKNLVYDKSEWYE